MHGSIPTPMMICSGSTFWADRNKIKKCLTDAFACGTLNMSQARADWKEANMTFVVYHGWAFPEKVAEFKTLKKAIAFIEGQKWPDEWCYEKKKVEK